MILYQVYFLLDKVHLTRGQQVTTLLGFKDFF